MYAGFAGHCMRPNQQEVRQPTMAQATMMPNRIMGLPSISRARMQYIKNAAIKMPAVTSQKVIYGTRFRVTHEITPTIAPMTMPAPINGTICIRRSMP